MTKNTIVLKKERESEELTDSWFTWRRMKETRRDKTSRQDVEDP